jgi:hypothetical protein
VGEEPEETDLWLCSFPRISFGQAVGSQLDSILKFLSISLHHGSIMFEAKVPPAWDAFDLGSDKTRRL